MDGNARSILTFVAVALVVQFCLNKQQLSGDSSMVMKQKRFMSVPHGLALAKRALLADCAKRITRYFLFALLLLKNTQEN